MIIGQVKRLSHEDQAFLAKWKPPITPVSLQ